MSLYSVFILLSILVYSIFLIYINRKNNIDYKVIGLSMLFTIVSMIYCSVIIHKILFKTYGLSSIGGVVGILLALYIYFKIDKENGYKIISSYIIGIPLLYSISKIGCVISGCCHGIKYSGFLNVTYNDLPYSVFPIQLTESVIFFIIFILVLYLFKKNNKYIIEVVLILCSVIKFSLDYLREVERIIFSTNQILCIIIFLIGIILLINKKLRYRH